MTIFFDFLRQEIYKTRKNTNRFLQNILFFVICCSIFLFLSKSQIGDSNFVTYLTSIISISLIFSILSANINLLKEDFDDGTIEQIILACENFEIFILAKMISGWIFYAVPIVISSYFVMFLVGVDEKFAFNFSLMMFFSSISISFISGFCSSLNLSSNKSSVVAIFVLPLIIPVLLIGNSVVFDDKSLVKSFEILLALDILFVIVSVFVTSKIIKILVD